jgi:DNA (cytosine-5)-methyltransferase 1
MNHPGTLMISKDITAEETKREICGAFADSHGDVVVGGIPCQCFTTSGKRDPHDPRLMLYKHFVDLVSRLTPSSVVIENVTDFMTMKLPDGTLVPVRIAIALRSLGYAVVYRTLNAADFGVPQCRQRIFLFGWKRGPVPRPCPTHDEHGLNGLPQWLTVRDAIGDLKDRGEDKAWGHIFTRHGSDLLKRIRTTPFGGLASKHYQEGYYRNPPDRPSITIRGAAWPLHYSKHRMLTPREGARIQGFSDDFEFFGSKGEVMCQIDNAVPPPLAKAVGLAVRNVLTGQCPVPSSDPDHKVPSAWKTAAAADLCP